MMMYNFIWFIIGLINEYCNFCEVIYNGCKVEVIFLEEEEFFFLDGENYEVFNIFGGNFL